MTESEYPDIIRSMARRLRETFDWLSCFARPLCLLIEARLAARAVSALGTTLQSSERLLQRYANNLQKRASQLTHSSGHASAWLAVYGIIKLPAWTRVMRLVRPHLSDALKQTDERQDNPHLNDTAYDLFNENLSSEGTPIVEHPTFRDRNESIEAYFLRGFSPEKHLWKKQDALHASSWNEIREDWRNEDPPYDDLREITVLSSRYGLITFPVWTEVTTAGLDDTLVRVKDALKNPVPSQIEDAAAVMNQSVTSIADIDRLVRQIVKVIDKKCRKGMAGESYASNVEQWGNGVLVVGVPMWAAMLPHEASADEFANSFAFQLGAGIEALEHTTLRQPWCPFDAIVVKWHPPRTHMKKWADEATNQAYPARQLSHRPPQTILRALTSDWLPVMAGQQMSVRWIRHATVEHFVRSRSNVTRSRDVLIEHLPKLRKANRLAAIAGNIFVARAHGVKEALLNLPSARTLWHRVTQPCDHRKLRRQLRVDARRYVEHIEHIRTDS